MRTWHSRTLAVVIISTTLAGRAHAQQPQPQEPYVPYGGTQPYGHVPPYAQTPPEQAEEKPPEHKSGDYDFGGQLRLPSGPDEEGEYATFNWVALDLQGTYWLLEPVTLKANIPIAIIHPDAPEGAEDPKYFGGGTVTFDARLPKLSFIPGAENTVLGLQLTGGYLTERAILLSEKDFPIYVGDYQPAFAGGVTVILKLSSVIDFRLIPRWVWQDGEADSVAGVQIPLSLVLALGDVLKVSADAGIFTGDDYSFSADEGGRIYAGAALDVKIGKLVFHAGAGVASLLTDEAGLYPSIGESLYIDLNVKYVK